MFGRRRAGEDGRRRAKTGEDGPGGNYSDWLVALSRSGSEWREEHRVKTGESGNISCALSDSRVLIGNNSKYMELFRVENGPRIARVHRINVPEAYKWFSATTRGSDTLVAMSYPYTDLSVRVHRLHGDRLEQPVRIQLKCPGKLLWLADRLLVTDFDEEKQSHAVIELEVSDTRLEYRREIVTTSENIYVKRLCSVNDGLAIFDMNSLDIMHYSFV